MLGSSLASPSGLMDEVSPSPFLEHASVEGRICFLLNFLISQYVSKLISSSAKEALLDYSRQQLMRLLTFPFNI